MSEDERAVVGHRATDDGGRVSLIEQFMPRFDTRSQHAIEVHAPAQAVFTAVEAVTVREVRFLRELEFIRALPRLAATGRLDVPTVDAPLVHSFTRGAVLLGARPPEEVLVGAIGCFWRLADNEPVVFGSPEEFLTFTEPGFAKAVVGFRLDPSGAEILLTTETRFVATDEATHRLMSRYWRIIRPGSNRIRTEWLRAIRRRALRRPKATPESTQHFWTHATPTSVERQREGREHGGLARELNATSGYAKRGLACANRLAGPSIRVGRIAGCTFAGDLAAATSLIEEAQAVSEAIGSHVPDSAHPEDR